MRQGFTLIELSIVLVIIGLIVGGVLAGQSLINAAQVRATITQIEKYNSAANTFYGKYGYLPGDIPAITAAQFGFVARGQYKGEGDGNGVIEGVYCNGMSCDGGLYQSAGETVVFWVDLSQTNMIEGTFNTATSSTFPGSDITGTALANYFPPAKLGQGNYIYVWSLNNFVSGGNNLNYFGLSAITSSHTNGPLYSSPALSVAQAYSIDKKLDDGMPATGRVIDQYVSSNGYPMSPSSQSGSSTTCGDNGGVYGAALQYSIAQNGGAGVNCALSFQFQ